MMIWSRGNLHIAGKKCLALIVRFLCFFLGLFNSSCLLISLKVIRKLAVTSLMSFTEATDVFLIKNRFIASFVMPD